MPVEPIGGRLRRAQLGLGRRGGGEDGVQPRGDGGAVGRHAVAIHVGAQCGDAFNKPPDLGLQLGAADMRELQAFQMSGERSETGQ